MFCADNPFIKTKKRMKARACVHILREVTASFPHFSGSYTISSLEQTPPLPPNKETVNSFKLETFLFLAILAQSGVAGEGGEQQMTEQQEWQAGA